MGKLSPIDQATQQERLRCAAQICEGCRQHGKPFWREGDGGDKYAQHPPYEVFVYGDTGYQVTCLAERIWEVELEEGENDGSPQS